MKSLNIKKIVAVGAGLALVAATASAALSWSELKDDTAKSVKVNGIVVGSTADSSDTQAAQDLAAVFASKASYKVTESVKQTVEQCDVKLGTDVETKKKFQGTAINTSKTGTDNFAVGTVVAKGSNVGTDILADESSLSYKVGNSTYTTSARETVAMGAEAIFDARHQVGDMGLAYDAGDFVYTVTFGDLNFAKDSTGYSSPTWTDGSNDKVIIPFLGKNYMVYSINDSTKEVVLVDSSAVKPYQVGEKITGLVGKDGKDYYVTIDGVIYSANPDTVRMTLYDAATGAAVNDDAYVNAKISEGETFAEDFLATGVDVHTVDNEGTADVPVYMIEILVGKDKLTLKNNEGFPYDSTKTKISEYDWKSTVSIANGKLTSIAIENTSSNDRSYTDKDMLKAGETAWFFNNFIGVRFDGLQLPEFKDFASTTKETTTLKFVGELADSENMPGVEYYGSDDAMHELPLYYQLTLDEAEDGNYAATFTIDGQDKIIKIWNKNDVNYNVYTGTGNDVDGTYSTAITDWNMVASDVSSTAVSFDNSGDLAAQYLVGYDTTNNVLWLFLNGGVDYKLKTSAATYGAFRLNTTDLSYNSTWSGDKTYFVPHLEGDVDALAAVDFVSNQATLAKFWVDEDSTTAAAGTGVGQFVAYLNTETFQAPQVGEGGATEDIPGPTGDQINYYSSAISIKDGKSTGISWAYDPFGTKFGVEDSYPYFEIPEAQAYPEVHFVVSGAGDKNCYNVEKEVPTEVTKYFTNVDATGLKVLTDKDATAGNKYIVVGGYMVNSLFPEALKSKLQADGDVVSEWADNLYVVAGWTKEQTKSAVDEIINALNL